MWMLRSLKSKYDIVILEISHVCKRNTAMGYKKITTETVKSKLYWCMVLFLASYFSDLITSATNIWVLIVVKCNSWCSIPTL